MHRILLLLLLIPAVGLAEPLRVFASVVPVQTFVKKIGGEHVDARAMVRPGFSPAIYEPTPQQIAALADAALYVRIGVPFEDAWMERIRSANPTMAVIDAREGIALRGMEAHTHDDHQHGDWHARDDVNQGKHEHDGEHHPPDAAREVPAEASPAGHLHDQEQDPHVWTSPLLVKHMIGVIRDKLTELDPAHKAEFSRNHAAFAAELDTLDRDLHALLDPLPNRRFMVFHPAWGYFADAYGLTQVPIELEGKEPGVRALAALIEQAKAETIRVIFVQPQFDQRQAREVARAIGGAVIAVDPLAADYVDNLSRVGREFARALQR